MSIQLRLSLAIGLLSALGLACMVVFILFDAKPRMEVENASTMLLTATLIRSSLLPLKDSADPKTALKRLVDELKTLRHASVALASQPSASAQTVAAPANLWWTADKTISIAPLHIPVEVRGTVIDTIIVTPRPGDELAELWDAIARVVQWGVIVSIVTLVLTWLIVKHSVSSIEVLRQAMNRMAAGDYAAEVRESGPPEIRSIGSNLNNLAAALRTVRHDNRRLTTHMISIQDQERRDIARELHDELGPYLFAIRTDGALITRDLEKAQPDVARALRLNKQILGHVDLLQQTNKRVLDRLTPPGLSELGLSGALRAMTEMWRRNRSEVALDIVISGNIDALDETVKLTVYRIVQEGLTNAFRHSAADIINVAVSITPANETGKTRAVEIAIRDNGNRKGASDPILEGFGLRAMRERVSALSGSFAIGQSQPNGTLLSISLPMVAEAV